MSTVQERCDVVLGQSGDMFICIAGYKVKEDDTENHYKFGVYLDYPKALKDMPDGDLKKLAVVGHNRIVSVSQAPFKAKLAAGEMGQADVEAWRDSYNGENFLVRLNEVKERATAGPKVVDPLTKMIIAEIAGNLELKDQANPEWDKQPTKFPIPTRVTQTYGKNKVVKTNYEKWAAQFTQHPLWDKVKKEKEAKMAKAAQVEM